MHASGPYELPVSSHQEHDGKSDQLYIKMIHSPQYTRDDVFRGVGGISSGAKKAGWLFKWGLETDSTAGRAYPFLWAYGWYLGKWGTPPRHWMEKPHRTRGISSPTSKSPETDDQQGWTALRVEDDRVESVVFKCTCHNDQHSHQKPTILQSFNPDLPWNCQRILLQPYLYRRL